jgi:hypothetical protein
VLPSKTVEVVIGPQAGRAEEIGGGKPGLSARSVALPGSMTDGFLFSVSANSRFTSKR